MTDDEARRAPAQNPAARRLLKSFLDLCEQRHAPFIRVRRASQGPQGRVAPSGGARQGPSAGPRRSPPASARCAVGRPSLLRPPLHRPTMREPLRSSGSGRRDAARHLSVLPRCEGGWVGALVHWYLASQWCESKSKSLCRDHCARARAPSPRPFAPHSGTPPDRAAAARGHFLSHAERAALARRFAATRWSMGRTIDRRSVAQPSRGHRGQLHRPGAALERPYQAVTTLTITSVSGRRRQTMPGGATDHSSTRVGILTKKRGGRKILTTFVRTPNLSLDLPLYQTLHTTRSLQS